MLLWDLRQLKDVVIPDGIEMIGNYWFSSSGIESIVIPVSVREIGIEAFCCCSQLKQVTFSDDSQLEKLDNLFFNRSGLTEESLPPSVRHIGVRAFYECRSLKTLALNEDLETIGESAFEHTSLENVTIPKTVKRLNNSVFCDCTNL